MFRDSGYQLYVYSLGLPSSSLCKGSLTPALGMQVFFCV